MKLFQVFLLYVVLAFTTSRAADAQTQEDFERAQSNYVSCGQALEYSGAYDEFFRHMTTPANPNPTLEQLADTSMASPSEIKATLAWHKAAQGCRDAYIRQLSWILPSYVPIYRALWVAKDGIMVNVVQRRLAWGDALQRLVRVGQIADQLLAEDNTRRQAADAAVASQERAEEQARDEALMRMGQQLLRPSGR